MVDLVVVIALILSRDQPVSQVSASLLELALCLKESCDPLAVVVMGGSLVDGNVVCGNCVEKERAPHVTSGDVKACDALAGGN
jgi:hypothetical protein